MKVKAIQSFVRYQEPDNRVPIDKNYAYIAKLSSLLLKKHYGEVTLYTNEAHKKAFQKMNFPYKYDTEVLSKEKSAIFSEPKLQTFLAQDKPYIHFDLDTIVGDKIDLYSKTTPFLFSHPDQNKTGFREEGKIKEKRKSKVVHKLLQDLWFHKLFSSYLKFLYILKLPNDWPADLIIPEYIPNMNIVGVKDTELFNKAVHKALSIAENNRDHLNEWHAACFIEQLVIPLYLSALSPEYKKAQKAFKDNVGVDSFVLNRDEPFECTEIDINDNIPISQFTDKLLEYPFELVNNYSCTECLDFHKRKYTINSDEELAERLDLIKYRFVHIGGVCKSIPMYQAMTIFTLKKYFGVEAVLEVTKAYLGKAKAAKLTPGELAYEQLTGDRLFSDLYGFPRKKSLV